MNCPLCKNEDIILVSEKPNKIKYKCNGKDCGLIFIIDKNVKLVCPSCNSEDVILLNKNKYSCNGCNTTFMVVFDDFDDEHLNTDKTDNELEKFITSYDGEPKANKTEMLSEIGRCLKLSSWRAQNERFISWQKQEIICKNQKGQYIVDS